MPAPRLKSAVVAAILCILIAAIGGTSTLAASSDRGPSDADRAADSPELRAALRDELARLAREDARRNTDRARRQRRASRTAYRDLAASEAVALLREDAPELLTSLDRDLELRPGERVLAARDDRTRLIDRPEGPHALAESLNPTTATDDDGEKKPIDLTLERKGNAFVPANAAVDIAIDEDLSDGITLARAGVTVRPSFGRPAAAAQVVAGEKVLFPNSDRDTDLLVAPLPEGFETYSYLRSEDSPERHRLEFDLPAGAELRPLTLGDMAKAGAEVVRDGRRLATVAPPQAWDADRQLVPVSYEVAGTSIRIEVDHREGDFRYPITLDPTVTDWYVFHQNPYDQNPNYWGGWFYHESPYQSWNPNYNPFYPLRASLWGHGLNIFLNAGDAPGIDWWGEWALDARPNTAIVGADFYRVNQQPAGTCIRFYTWSPSLGVRSWNQSCNTPYTNSEWHTWAPEAAPHGNRLAFNYVSNHDQPRTASGLSYVGEVWVHETDYDAPWFENWSSGPAVVHERRPVGWTSRAPDIVARPHLRDRGLGVYDSWIAYPAREGGTREVHDNWDSCTGNRSSQCPYNYAWNIPYSTDDMPEGINTVTAFGEDAVRNRVQGESWQVKVDRTGPELDTSGPLKDIAGETIKTGSYELWIDALDGDAATPRAGVQSIEVQIDGRRVDYVDQACSSGSCDLDRVWTLRVGDYAAGAHRAVVTATDFAGNVSRHEWRFDVAPLPESQDSDILGDATLASGDSLFDCVLSTSELTDPTLKEYTAGSWLGGTELTEFFLDGSYRVTRCGLTGSLEVQQTVGTITTPGGQAASAPLSTYRPNGSDLIIGHQPLYGDPEEETWQQEWATYGPAARANVIPPTSGPRTPAPNASPTAQSSANTECSYARFRREGYTWAARSYTYRVRQESLPGNAATRTRFRQRIEDGHRSWNGTINRCDRADQDNFSMVNAGDTQAVFDRLDGVNVRDFGPLGSVPGCEGGVACHRPYVQRANGRIVESDIRLNSRISLWPRLGRISGRGCVPASRDTGRRPCYDTWGTVAHEVGHSLGLAHVGDRYQTMFSATGTKTYLPDDRAYRSLGLSDIRGLRRLYPPG